MKKNIANINNNLIKELRRRTNIGILECKQSLIQANGNIELAIENMRKSGAKTTDDKSNRTTKKGIILIKLTPNKQLGVMIEINCETDFVSRNNIFQEFAKTVMMTALRENINDVNLINTMFIKQKANTIAILGENININRLIILQGQYLEYYIHGLKIGVIIATNKKIGNDIIKHIAMHIASEKPKYINVEDIPSDVIKREYHIQMEIAMKSGKPNNILEKIAKGRMNKFINEIVLKKQKFIMDTDKTIENLLNDHNIEINNFARFEIGEFYIN
ncbi:translation elongation factor Ts [Candidatus Blochmannia ocreatus (nom. nud.)]|uniref:Elongation factor Ts n=1 Tax=Candidatus Blochmannia ocreatus (nom. nud.) TaxID=251538 RepID=A0ABY4SYJ7_9ENTR|nr:translation elongation factor Ts [Candidatus Blochmannia ocreatus]URJ25338.1 translation elongation factor Ts [Candidatus Blochmannia ocreatus]